MATIKELRSKTANIPPLSAAGSLHIFEASGTQSGSVFRSQVDVGALQSTHNNALFQVASNFNGLETVFCRERIDVFEHWVERYVSDPTQGPAASISAAPGLIARRYYVFADKYPKEHSKWPQSDTEFLDFVEDLKKNYPDHLTNLSAGYVILNPNSPLPQEHDFLDVKVLYQDAIRVTHGFMQSRSEHEMLISEGADPVHVAQVYTAALDIASTNGRLGSDLKKAWSRVFLRAAYEGTILSAILLNHQHVYLTLIGGGVFGNSLEDIAWAISEQQDLIKKYGLTIHLPWYDSQRHRSSEATLFRDAMLDLIKSIGAGSYEKHANNADVETLCRL